MSLCPRLLPSVLAAGLFVLSPLSAEDSSVTPPDWRELARHAGLTESEVERLAEQKVLIAGPRCLLGGRLDGPPPQHRHPRISGADVWQVTKASK